jgi:hypothetical protein
MINYIDGILDLLLWLLSLISTPLVIIALYKRHWRSALEIALSILFALALIRFL